MSSPFGEPPPDIDLKENHTPRNHATVLTVYILAIVAVALRITARLKVQQANVLADDWLICIALVFSGLLSANRSQSQRISSAPLRLLLAYVLIYVVAIPLIKLSIILFYRRIFGMNWVMWICVLLTVGYWFSCTVAFLVCCRPLSYYWTQYRDPGGGKYIFNLYPFYIGNAAANVATDGIILMVPIPLVWKLQMRTAQKVLVSSIFLLGGFVCVASIVRIYFMTLLSRSLDITWIMGDVFIWSSVEPCIGIVCACLPTLQPLLKSALKHILGSSLVAGKFGASSSHEVELQRKARIQRVSSSRDKHCLLRSLDDSQHRNNDERLILRPKEDKAILTTNSEPAEDTQFAGDECSDGQRIENDFMSIRVHREFRRQEEYTGR
ncbi:integral membrane protein Pth11-like, putative [Aspergillus fumigatus A1163]|uniref:Integral membrane protein Pth11-like, putative n=1 Tax=Aspergillus fumigatus (strain CBS 144.89 / FGSC A1163 / CEA10) TaxID=451804 RepID=B0XM50_ASPFC|nr:integral membrane protein Pth11-like, putative [Aspergillus fumigatus A1163]